MATKDTLYRKFGEAVEAAQLLEAELGAWLATHYTQVEHLFPSPPPKGRSSVVVCLSVAKSRIL